MFPSACGVLVSGGWPAAPVGYVPTVFVCWGVGLVCRVVCLMAFRVLFTCAWLAIFLYFEFVAIKFIFSLGESLLL